MKPRKRAQSSKRRTRSTGTKTVCPRCGKLVSLEIKYPDAPRGSEEVECQVCGATLDVKYTCSIEVDDVKVVETPIPEVECPVCDTTLLLDDVDIDSETGRTGFDCPGGGEDCGAELEVVWSDWGRETEVEVINEPEEKEEEERPRSRRRAAKKDLHVWPADKEEEEDEDEDDNEDHEADYDDEEPDDDDGDRDEEEDDEDL